MKTKLLLLLGLVVLSFGCKKGQANITVEGNVYDATFSKALANAQIVVTTTSKGESKHILTTQTDSEGNYTFDVKRERFETLNISISKENYFGIQSSILFDDLSVKNKNVHNFSSTGKSWAKIHLKHTGDNTTKLDIVKSIGKSGCEECCSSDYQQFVGNLDTSYYCVNDANTNFEVTYFKQYSSTNGKKNAITPFMDTVEILIEY